MCRTRLVRLLSRDVHFNLATEESLFQRMSPAARTVLFYVNSPAVVIGRTQNPYYECDIAALHRTHGRLARRRSGGGTVVHDLGNVNVSVMCGTPSHSPPANSAAMQAALRRLRADPASTPRGDITLAGRKVSGSAYRLTRDRAYHHATLLVHSDLPALRSLLASPLRETLRPSGAPSVRSSVVNIAEHVRERVPGAEVRVDDVVNSVAEELAPGAEMEVLAETDVVELMPEVLQEVEALRDPGWVFGQTPRFSFGQDAGDMRVVVYFKKGGTVDAVHVLRGAKRDVNAVASPRGAPGRDEGLSAMLEGVRFEEATILERAQGIADPVLKRCVQEIAGAVPPMHVREAASVAAA